jgi:single-strand selective monofunctional uracil DNA glycosylase
LRRVTPAKTDLVSISRALADAVAPLCFAAPVACVYNPLIYARIPHEAYLRRYGGARGRVLLLGMNPGPFGMVQTGVPFGDPTMVRDFLGIDGAVERPAIEHPRRPIEGFSCRRGEISGTRLWGWARERFGDADAFFREFFVLNYCPLAFIEESGKNRTPDQLPAAERAPLFGACNTALAAAIDTLAPRLVVGIGGFAQERAIAVAGARVPVGTILHPSPASPRANRGWAREAERELAALGVEIHAPAGAAARARRPRQ